MENRYIYDMNDFILKYNTLSPEAREEVNDFLDFKLSKYKGKKTFDIKNWKKKISSVSVWTEEDIEVMIKGIG